VLELFLLLPLLVQLLYPGIRFVIKLVEYKIFREDLGYALLFVKPYICRLYLLVGLASKNLRRFLPLLPFNVFYDIFTDILTPVFISL